MTDFIIVCAHDGLKTGEALMRLLRAEQFRVELCYGRASLDHLEAAGDGECGVVMVWSLDAPSALYMLQWANEIEPSRLAEIARARRWPALPDRSAPVIDFSAWNGERGGPAWRALTQRLNAISRSLAPPKPPPVRAAAALAGLSALAMIGAMVDRLSGPAISAAPTPSNTETVAAIEPTPSSTLPEEGRGGPITAPEEPASFDDGPVTFAPLRHVALIPAPHSTLEQAVTEPPAHFRGPSLLDRFNAFLRDDEKND
jgi:hypothetical protein